MPFCESSSACPGLGPNPARSSRRFACTRPKGPEYVPNGWGDLGADGSCGRGNGRGGGVSVGGLSTHSTTGLTRPSPGSSQPTMCAYFCGGGGGGAPAALEGGAGTGDGCLRFFLRFLCFRFLLAWAIATKGPPWSLCCLRQRTGGT